MSESSMGVRAVFIAIVLATFGSACATPALPALPDTAKEPASAPRYTVIRFKTEDSGRKLTYLVEVPHSSRTSDFELGAVAEQILLTRSRPDVVTYVLFRDTGRPLFPAPRSWGDEIAGCFAIASISPDGSFELTRGVFN